MVAVALGHRFANDHDRLVTGVGLLRLAARAICFLVFPWGDRPGFLELAQPGRESGFEHLGICRRELVFEREGPVRPGGESLRVNELLELSDQLVSQDFGCIRRQTRWLGPFRTSSPVGRLRMPAGFWLDCRPV
jgi:hypothetical protein